MDNSALRNLLDRVRDKRAVVIGDIMLDRYVVGAANRISDEAPVPIVRVDRTEERIGGAGNAAANLAGIGVKVEAFGVVGADFEAKRLKDLLGRKGIGTQGVMSDRARPTTLKTRVVARTQQVVRIDWEDQTCISGRVESDLHEAFIAAIQNADFVIVSDYGKGVFTERFFRLVQELHGKGELDLKKRPIMLDPNPANYRHYSHFSIAKPNRKEAEEALGRSIRTELEAKNAADELRTLWQTSVILLSLGDKGMVVASETGSFVMPTRAREVFDVSGAGDTVTAVFSAALSAGGTLEESAQLANLAAGIVVGEIGTVAVTREKILAALNE